jgi:macrolide-specific efflux system membrane fusion protein
VVGALVVVGGIGTWLLTTGDGSGAAPTLTAEVSSGTVKQSVSASGTIEPAKSADLDFGVGGTVTKVYVAAGDTVVKGQALAAVDSSALVAARTAAQASYDAALAQHADDIDAGASDVQLAADQTAVLSAKSDLDAAVADVKNAVLRSTINGTVSAIDLEVGDVVSGSGSSGSGTSGSGGSSGTGSAGSGSSMSNAASSSTTSGSTAAVTVTSTDRYIVDATVSAEDASQVKKGMQAQITATGSSTPVYGTVSAVGMVAEANSSGAAVFPVTIAVTGKQKDLYAGTSATASITVKQVADVLTVTSRAIQSSGQSTYVMKMVDGKAVKTPVKIGTVYGATTEILSGLSDGDTVQVPGVTMPSGGSTSGNRTGGGSGFPSGRTFGGGFGGGVPSGGFPGGGQ